MPTYVFKCEDCGHTNDVFMTMADYEPVLECPQCRGNYKRLWSGKGISPGIKTVKRVEDLWKQMGWLDPEDPDYHKVNKQRVRAMREDAIKKRDRKLNKADLKKGRTKDFKRTNKPADYVSKQELDNLPDAAKDRVNIDEMTKDE